MGSATLLGSVFVVSLLGSLHCGVMCGPLLAGASAVGFSPALYQLGRLAAYAGLGAAAGSIGQLGFGEGWARDLGNWLSFTAAVLFVGLGLRALGGAGLTAVRVPGFGGMRRWLKALAERQSSRRWASLLWGLTTALLPCGWLWMFVLGAASTGRSSLGALLLCLHWAGSLPALLGVHWLSQRVTGVLRWRRFRAMLLVACGSLILIVKGTDIGPSLASRLGPSGREVFSLIFGTDPPNQNILCK